MTFDAHLFEILENWRWQNKFSRARAVNYILESFFSNLKEKGNHKQQGELNLK